MKHLVLLLALWPLALTASTIEVIRLYQPLSLHGTDGAGEHQEVDELLQASVMATPYALSGAFPEDLVKAVALPNRIPTNNIEGYTVKEANLILISKLHLEASLDEGKLMITINVKELSIPEEVDLTSRQILKMTIASIQKTLETYYEHGEETLYCEIEIVGVGESNATLVDLSQKFTIGE